MTSTLTWHETAPYHWEAKASDGSIWRYSAISGVTTEVTDIHEAGSPTHLDAHSSAIEAMDRLAKEIDS